MPARRSLLLATTNPGKIAEYAGLLAGLPFEIVTLKDLALDTPVEETETTIAANASLKAREYARLSRMPTVADDSGLEIDALGGEPGVRSSRYAGPDATDADRNRLVLAKMRDVPDNERTARFRCVIAATALEGPVHLAEGVCEGLIAREPRGSNGFGYDPIFYIPELGAHMAELSLDQKNRISHRGKALRQAKDLIAAVLAGA